MRGLWVKGQRNEVDRWNLWVVKFSTRYQSINLINTALSLKRGCWYENWKSGYKPLVLGARPIILLSICCCLIWIIWQSMIIRYSWTMPNHNIDLKNKSHLLCKSMRFYDGDVKIMLHDWDHAPIQQWVWIWADAVGWWSLFWSMVRNCIWFGGRQILDGQTLVFK